ncbi:MAG: hypothetical protein P8K76_09840 [Candidatus Binatia bacterium]|nr:hypothetical protein [Candidatus Binatia bacterium]MDG1959869.1 hypothetical protein [Candidatus Binatia bacterium]MDG2010070.1 hypothetical protein [Candidatus Binatia bacterium]
MKRGFWLGTACGVLLSVLLGLGAAALPLTPTWTLVRLTQAIDTRNTTEISRLIDFTAVAQRGLNEIARGDLQTSEGFGIGAIALTLLEGGRIRTIFDDPVEPASITPSEFAHAWWGMRRDGPFARLTLTPKGLPVDLTLAPGPGGRWRIVGIEPLAGLLRLESSNP